MSRWRALLVDDEAPARRKLRRLLEVAPEIEVVGEAANVASAVASVAELAPHLVFLDLRLPGGHGLEVVRRVGVEKMPPVVFVTAHDEAALAAFEIGACDYLVKPVTPARFERALERIRRRLEAPDPAALARELEGLLRRAGGAPDYLERVTVWVDDRGVFLPVERIDQFEAARSHVWAHAGGKRYLIRHGLADLAARLDPTRFQRIHRSHVVRLAAIRELRTWFHGDLKVVLADGAELLWSRRFRGGRNDPRTLL